MHINKHVYINHLKKLKLKEKKKNPLKSKMPKRKATNVTVSEETINEEDEENGVLTETNLNTQPRQARGQHHLTTQINTPKRKRVSQAFSDLSHLNDVNEVNLERINLIFSKKS